ncbi:glycoside hydrolase family 29 protein [Annulohypoxylon truncatum]|uniref:glycoside hydrolase family 29 protein n=1 Tax=Annulohypoxylon truncatum TaxID=327061 RepID=UPI00200770DE|nr:glycoside hydrolase family 29 protein [Annulohypoxylon truncatum]KAI1207540.1 glycoside hydrolase family 29 protein [Annulohypoxylon truncatum]
MVVGYRTLTSLLSCVTVFAAASRLKPSGLQSIPLDLSPFYNNKAFGTYPGETSFDTLGQSYPAPDLDTPYYTSSYTGLVYSFPGYTGPNKSDNVIVDGQTIAVPAGSYFSASFLISEDKELAIVSGNVTFTYTDNSTSVYELRSLDWFSFLTINRGELIFPSRFTATGVDYNTSHIFERTAALSPGKELRAISLPEATSADDGRLHVFAISLWTGGSAVDVQSVRPTQKWISSGVQAVEITLNNAGSECVAGDGLNLTLLGDGLQTAGKGYLKRLCPGDQKIVTIGVESTSSAVVNVSVILDYAGSQRTTEFDNIQFGLTEWTTDLDNLAKHESPEWFNNAKYGIFIHWGPYAVTGWGNSSPYESYAEWFWWYSTHHPQADPSDFYDYRLRTYGKDWAYDDTFPNFTASAYDPKAWVDLIADAGAKYFVITSKHHDGFSLFDAGSSSNRSALHYGPQRDVLGELFDAAAKYQPQLKRGTYFSLPEWFNPDFGPYGFDQFDPATVPGTNSWPGVQATNPYTGAVEPYTGRIPVDDFLTDVMLPQMDTLAYDYGTDIMWCDCGAANVTATFASSWFNAARKQDRQVAINSRCGVPQAADFDTPEYMRFGSAQRRKWESNQGMDPYSYGYNQATPASAYMNATTLIYTLVDIVSKNGNLLLDVGPRADGTIVQAEVDRLREAGRWIKSHGEAVFDTTYWFVQSEIEGGPDVRFTQADGAFYVLFLERPAVEDGVVKVAAPVPVLKGDEVSLLAVEGGGKLAWKVIGQGSQAVLNIEVTDALLDKEEYCWVFKIEYA